jgi:hypothetical protein
VTRATGTLRFRHSSAITVAAAIAVISGLSIGRWAPYLLPLLIIPVLIGVWAWRAGTDVDAEAVTVRAAIAGRRIPWSEITGFAVDSKGRVIAELNSGRVLPLTAVRPADLPSVIATSGQDLVINQG